MYCKSSGNILNVSINGVPRFVGTRTRPNVEQSDDRMTVVYYHLENNQFIRTVLECLPYKNYKLSNLSNCKISNSERKGPINKGHSYFIKNFGYITVIFIQSSSRKCLNKVTVKFFIVSLYLSSTILRPKKTCILIRHE